MLAFTKKTREQAWHKRPTGSQEPSMVERFPLGEIKKERTPSSFYSKCKNSIFFKKKNKFL